MEKKKQFKWINTLSFILLLVFLLSIPAYASETFSTIDEAGKYVKERMKERKTDFSVSFYCNISKSNVLNELEKIYFEHTGDPVEGDYLLNQVDAYRRSFGSYSYTGNQYFYTIKFNLSYRASASQEQELTTRVNQIMKQLNLKGKSDYQKIKAIYKYITDTVVYDYSFPDISHSAYAAGVLEKAVCQGYAALLYRMLLIEGIDTRVITGGNHAWNIVKIGKVYYNLDSTWDAGQSTYSYFLISEEKMARDHDRSNGYENSFNGWGYYWVYDRGSDAFMAQYPMSSKDYSPNTNSTSTTYTIKFDANGGNNAPAKQTKKKGIAITITTSKPTRNGYVFQGWSTIKNGSTVNYKPGAKYTANKSTTLYAVWKKKSVNVATAKITLVEKTKNNKLVIRVKKQSEAAGYEIYRASSKNGKYVLVATTSDTTYTDKNLKSGCTYYYKVRAFAKSGTITKYGSYSAVVSASTAQQPKLEANIKNVGEKDYYIELSLKNKGKGELVIYESSVYKTKYYPFGSGTYYSLEVLDDEYDYINNLVIEAGKTENLYFEMDEKHFIYEDSEIAIVIEYDGIRYQAKISADGTIKLTEYT